MFLTDLEQFWRKKFFRPPPGLGWLGTLPNFGHPAPGPGKNPIFSIFVKIKIRSILERKSFFSCLWHMVNPKKNFKNFFSTPPPCKGVVWAGFFCGLCQISATRHRGPGDRNLAESNEPGQKKFFPQKHFL